MRKAQTLVIQFVLFFLIGLTIFLAVGNLFRLQVDIFTTDVLKDSLKLTSSFLNSILIYSADACKQCDWVNITVALPEKITHYYYKVNFTRFGAKISIFDRPEYYFSFAHNLNYTFNLGGEASSPQKIALTFDRTKYKLELVGR